MVYVLTRPLMVCVALAALATGVAVVTSPNLSVLGRNAYPVWLVALWGLVLAAGGVLTLGGVVAVGRRVWAARLEAAGLTLMGGCYAAWLPGASLHDGLHVVAALLVAGVAVGLLLRAMIIVGLSIHIDRLDAREH